LNSLLQYRKKSIRSSPAESVLSVSKTEGSASTSSKKAMSWPS